MLTAITGAVVDWQDLQYQTPAVGTDLVVRFPNQDLMSLLLLQPSPKLAACLQGPCLASVTSRAPLHSTACQVISIVEQQLDHVTLQCCISSVLPR